MLRQYTFFGIFVIFFIFQVSVIKSQTESFTELVPGTRSIAMGQTASSSFSDATSGYLNPANIINARKSTISLFYSSPGERFEYKGCGLAIPLKTLGSLGFGYYKLSSKVFSLTSDNAISEKAFEHQHYILGYAKTVFNSIAVGMNTKYIITDILQGEGTHEYSAIDLGIQYQPEIANSILSNITFGFSMDNLVQLMKPAENNNDLLRYYRFIIEKRVAFGANAIQIITNLALNEEYSYKNKTSIDLTKETSRPKIFWGIEYERENFCLRLGQAANSITGGVGIKLKSFNLGYAHGRLIPEGSLANSISISFEY
ncbi:MAG TPA: hypothetical protein PLP19_12430 [bacterium]|nr:hypothetical protein [bacterium]HPN44291.1 hypothetical protein [bacterium]